MIMERRTYNQLKREILEIFLYSENVTSEDVAEDLNCDIHNARMCLLRLFRQQLVTREIVHLEPWGKPVFEYNITDKGFDRLIYYKSLDLVE